MSFSRAYCLMSVDCLKEHMRVVFIAMNSSGSHTLMFFAMFQVRYTIATIDWYLCDLFHSYLIGRQRMIRRFQKKGEGSYRSTAAEYWRFVSGPVFQATLLHQPFAWLRSLTS